MTTTFHTSRESNAYCNADMLSRLPIEAAPTNVPVPGDTIMLLETLQSSPMIKNSLRHGTIRIHYYQMYEIR